MVCESDALVLIRLPSYYRDMAAPDKNNLILLTLFRALSSLDKNFPLPFSLFLLEVARNEGC
jgi:hypothetical protein